MKLADWARRQGIHYMTAWRWFKAGKLPVSAYQTPTGTILVEPKQQTSNDTTWCYCRVSSYDKKEDLGRQAQRCIDFCHQNGWEIERTVKEIASSTNDKRPKLIKMLKARPGRIVVEHKDRLARFGFHYFDLLLPMLGVALVVMNRDHQERIK